MGMQRIRRTYCLLFSDTEQHIGKLLGLRQERQMTRVHGVDPRFGKIGVIVESQILVPSAGIEPTSLP